MITKHAAFFRVRSPRKDQLEADRKRLAEVLNAKALADPKLELMLEREARDLRLRIIANQEVIMNPGIENEEEACDGRNGCDSNECDACMNRAEYLADMAMEEAKWGDSA